VRLGLLRLQLRQVVLDPVLVVDSFFLDVLGRVDFRQSIDGGGSVRALLVGLPDVVQALLLECALELSRVVGTEEDLFTATREHIAARRVNVLLLRQVQEGDLVLEALLVERDILLLQLVQLFSQASMHDLAG